MAVGIPSNKDYIRNYDQLSAIVYYSGEWPPWGDTSAGAYTDGYIFIVYDVDNCNIV